MSRKHLSAALLCAALVPAAFAAAPPPPPTPAEIQTQKLIEQLGDQDFRSRELAEKRLRAEGAAALPLLRRALRHRELEVRRRALRLIPGIENAVLFAPRLVSFRVKNQPLKQVLEALSKSSGYKVVDGNEGMMMGMPFPAGPQPAAKADPKEKTYTYEFASAPFWDVVDRICRDAGMGVQQSWGDDVVRLYHTNGHAPHVGRCGPFRYVAGSLQMYRSVDLGSSSSTPRTETLTLNFTVFAEPRLPLMGQGEVRLEYAYDELKNSMLVKREGFDPNEGGWRAGLGFRGRRYYGGYKQMTMHLGAQLERRSAKATMIKSLKGVAPMTILVEQRQIVLAEKVLTAKGAKKQVGDLTFEMKEAKKIGNNQVQVAFTVTHKGGNDYTWQNNLYNRAELYDDQGNKYQMWGTSWGGAGPNVVNLTLTYNSSNIAKPGEPTRFVFIHWETRQYDVEFEFKNLPLP